MQYSFFASNTNEISNKIKNMTILPCGNNVIAYTPSDRTNMQFLGS